jgi:hypothetical protein
MRTYRSKHGPLPEQIFYEVGEIENICRDELQGVGLYPSEPSPIRIDFLSKSGSGSYPATRTFLVAYSALLDSV